jgi:hypothetical protein
MDGGWVGSPPWLWLALSVQFRWIAARVEHAEFCIKRLGWKSTRVDVHVQCT